MKKSTKASKATTSKSAKKLTPKSGKSVRGGKGLGDMSYSQLIQQYEDASNK